MICRFRRIESDGPVAIHRTFLDPKTGAKTPRRMLGPVGNAAIKFDAVTDSLAVGEGVETTMAGRLTI